LLLRHINLTLNAMKKIIKTIEIEIEKLRDIIQTREDKVDDMSERWQESEKCDDWLDKTMDIEEQVNELELVIDNLKDLI
jgi:hypothetical protein